MIPPLLQLSTLDDIELWPELNSRDTGDTAKMKPKNSHAMTLRTSTAIDSLICDAAYDARLSKAAWIRRAIHVHLGQQRRREAATREPVLR